MSGGLAAAAAHDAVGRHDDAINELALATQRGELDAMTELGRRLLVGDRAPLLPRDGARFLLDAANAGNPEAALRLATLTALGAHVDQSWKAALSLLAFAAERGSEFAQGQLLTLAGRPLACEPPAGGWLGMARGIDLDAWLSPLAGTTLHQDPLVRSFSEFVPEPACEWLMARARGRLKRALIYDPELGDVADQMRTNSAVGFDLLDVDVVQVAIQHRMAAATGLPVENLEGPTILHYKVGEQITEHFDFVNPRIPNYEDEINRRGERVITFLVYLNDDYAGGETEFPHIGVRHKGRRRDALFFTNALPGGKPDTRMVHAGRPPSSGEKWMVTQFIRSRAAFNARAERVG
jgi:prolyl 4-hydroxylase